MAGHTERRCDGIAGRRPIPWADASPGREFVATDPAPGTIPVALDDDVIPPRLTACDPRARAVWQVRSTHRTSAGAVGYARCPCGAWLVLLEGRPLATAHSRPRVATPLVPGERPHGRRRLWLRLWDHGRALRGMWRRRLVGRGGSGVEAASNAFQPPREQEE
jgi:hypothetical protein